MKRQLLSSKVSSPTRILISGETCSLTTSLKDQLQNYSHLQVTHWSSTGHNLQSPINIAAVIHVIGFGPPSLSQTLSATSLLHELLHLAFNQHAKFILAVFNPQTSLAKTAMNLVAQFSKNHPLSYFTLEVGQDEVDQEAESIIKKIVPHHKNFVIVKPKIIYPAKSLPTKPKNMRTLLTVSAVLFIVLSLIALTVGQIFLHISQKSLAEENYTAFAKYLDFSGKLTPHLTLLSPLFHPKIINSAKELYQVSTSLDSSLNSLLSFSAPTDSNLITNLIPQINLLSEKIGLIQSQITSPLLLTSLSNSQSLLQKVRVLIPYLNLVLGNSQPQVTMVVVLDSTHPTPVGGEISSLVVFTIDKGQIQDVKNFTFSQLVQAAPGKLDPTLLDAEPEFKHVATLLSQLLLKTYQLQPSLVIGVTQEALSQLFPNLESVDSILKFLSQTGPISRRDLLSKSYQLLEGHQISLTHPSIPELDLMGWSGELSLPQCRTKLSCVQVFFDSRLGPATPESETVSLPTTQLTDIHLSDKSLLGKIILSLYTPPHSSYLLQIFTSRQAKMSQVLVDGITQNLQSSTSAYNRQLTRIITPIKNSDSNSRAIDVTISFTQDLSVSSEKFHFQIDLPAQPGIKRQETTQVVYPQNWTSLLYQKPSVALPGQLRYNTQSQKSLNFDIDFTSK
jgi:hypothetical protein